MFIAKIIKHAGGVICPHALLKKYEQNRQKTTQVQKYMIYLM